MSFIDAYKAVEPFFDSSFAVIAQEKLDTFLYQASCGNGDAIGILQNLALRADATGTAALKGLQNLYAEPLTDESVRGQLREAAFHACDIAFLQADKRGGAPSLPMPVAYLGGQYAQETQGLRDRKDRIDRHDRKDRIERHISEQIVDREIEFDVLGKLLPPERYVTTEEVTLAVRDTENLKAHPQILNVGEPANFASEVEKIKKSLDRRPVFAWIHANNHWMPAILLKQNGVAHCWLVNSVNNDTYVTDAKSLLKRASFVTAVHQDAMQDNVRNACGPLGLHLFKHLTANMTDKTDMGALITGHLKNWRGLDADAQRAIVTTLRLQMLGNLADARKAAGAA
jgi:hypothetical protein